MDALQLAAVVGGADLGGLLGGDVAAEVDEAAGVQALQYLAGAGVQDCRQPLRRLLRLGHGGRPGGHRVALDGEGEHAPVAVQDGAAFHLRQAHGRPLRGEVHPGHERSVAKEQGQHAEAEEREEQIEPPHDGITRRPPRRGIEGGGGMQRLAAVGAHIGYIGAAAQIASAERRKRDVAGGAVSRGRGTGAGAPACGAAVGAAGRAGPPPLPIGNEPDYSGGVLRKRAAAARAERAERCTGHRRGAGPDRRRRGGRADRGGRRAESRATGARRHGP